MVIVIITVEYAPEPYSTHSGPYIHSSGWVLGFGVEGFI